MEFNINDEIFVVAHNPIWGEYDVDGPFTVCEEHVITSREKIVVWYAVDEDTELAVDWADAFNCFEAAQEECNKRNNK